MADVTDGPVPGRTAERAGALVQYAGAALSAALVVGVGIWGYQIFVRDVTGVPIVRAMAGPMRIAPADPGGTIAPNMGLSVNAVVARGEAAPPEDVLLLAPVSNGLAPEDMEVQSMAEAGEVEPELAAAAAVPPGDRLGTEQVTQVALETEGQAADVVAPTEVVPAAEPSIDLSALPDTPMTPDQVLALADQIAAGAVPLTALSEGTDAPVALSVDGQTVAALADPVAADTDGSGAPASDLVASAVPDTMTVPETMAVPETPVVPDAAAVTIIPASVPGVAVALRPPVRPTGLSGSTTSAAQPEAAVSTDLVSAVEIPVGTSLVQLGAFPSPEIAATEWDRLNARFAEFLTGKERVIQQAASGGDTFYRLRAMGFADLEDARRFCAALKAEDAGCIPVVVE